MTPEAPALPAAWTAKLLPRRGTRPGTPTEPEPDAPDLLAERFEVHADLLSRILHMKRNRRHRQPIDDYLSGAPDLAGAVAAGELLRYVGPHTPDEWSRLELHAWLRAHGLAWAASAFVERHAVEIAAYYTEGVRPQMSGLHLTAASWHSYRSLHRDMDSGLVAELRAHLAAASDEEYRAVVAAVADHRGGPSQRLAAALLLPDEADWTAEVCEEYHEHNSSGGTDRFLFHFVSRAAHLKAARVHKFEEYYLDAERIAAALDSLGDQAFGLLSRTFGTRWQISADNRRLLAKGLALLPEGAAYLVANLDRPHAFDGAVEGARLHPEAALRAVAAAAPDAAPAQRGRLAAVAEAAGALDGLADAERAAVAGLAQRTVPDADPADLHYLFTAPPWTVKRRKAKPQVIEGLEPVGEPRLAWNEGERERWLDLVASYVDDPETAASWRGHSARRLTGDSARYLLPSLLAFGPPDAADPYYGQWLASDAEPGQDQILAILARYGPESIPKAVKAAEYCEFDQVLGPVFSLDAARHVAERYARRKTDRALAAAWFARHGIAVATVLVPDALGADKDRRKYAEAALFHLAVRLGDKEIVAAAAPYGPEAAAAVAALFDGDPSNRAARKSPGPAPGPCRSCSRRSSSKDASAPCRRTRCGTCSPSSRSPPPSTPTRASTWSPRPATGRPSPASPARSSSSGSPSARPRRTSGRSRSSRTSPRTRRCGSWRTACASGPATASTSARSPAWACSARSAPRRRCAPSRPPPTRPSSRPSCGPRTSRSSASPPNSGSPATSSPTGSCRTSGSAGT
nr:hypothetical protein GCM10025732_46930 [Glycomyces mayteni]